MSDAARALLDALSAAGRAFEGDDAEAASARLDEVLRAQAAIQDSGLGLDAGTLEAARSLHAAAVSAALEAARRLDARLRDAGTARRAAGAYAR